MTSVTNKTAHDNVVALSETARMALCHHKGYDCVLCGE